MVYSKYSRNAAAQNCSGPGRKKILFMLQRLATLAVGGSILCPGKTKNERQESQLKAQSPDTLSYTNYLVAW